ncbi:MAG: hypothetical protein WD355_02410 [Balneolaceae bacterium]
MTSSLPRSPDMTEGAIGGFFELELSTGSEYHQGALRTGSGRMAFELIVKASEAECVWLPHFICNSMVDTVRHAGAECRFFHLDEEMWPIIDDPDAGERDLLLYVNYFGIFSHQVQMLSEKFGSLIIDNAQSFFSRSIPGVSTFYSARKFFGVPDGSYLFTNLKTQTIPEFKRISGRPGYLTERIDMGAEAAFSGFQEHENSFQNAPVQGMSPLGRRILRSIDYGRVRRVRLENYLYLDRHLKQSNRFSHRLPEGSVPMVYPYLCGRTDLRETLTRNRIYTAQYWRDVLARTDSSTLEYHLADRLIPLPIDQRYGREEMDRILEVIENG